jgi:hydroxymethylpyrimidine pyrophosphatase-like HAD family hydrolase
MVPYGVVRAAYTLALAERYNAVGLDFDGTLVPLRSGEDVPENHICRDIERISSQSIPIGVFTGRGTSVMRGLRTGLSRSAWGNITCFLYNGALRWKLDEESPQVFAKISNIDAVLSLVEDVGPGLSQYFGTLERSSFDCQITINIDGKTSADIQSEIVSVLAELVSSLELSVACSGRSVDIFPAAASKLRALRQWSITQCIALTDSQVLVIGDQGNRTGNDFELLSLPGGFSVDRIDWSPRNCFPVQVLLRNQRFDQTLVGPSLTSFLLQRLAVDQERIILTGLL